jgi:hypothetical protein
LPKQKTKESKMKKVLHFFLYTLVSPSITEAQLLKKIKQKAEQAPEGECSDKKSTYSSTETPEQSTTSPTQKNKVLFHKQCLILNFTT